MCVCLYVSVLQFPLVFATVCVRECAFVVYVNEYVIVCEKECLSVCLCMCVIVCVSEREKVQTA